MIWSGPSRYKTRTRRRTVDHYCVDAGEHLLDDVEVETVEMNKSVSSKFLLSVGVPSKFANSASGGGWRRKVEVSRPSTVGGGRMGVIRSLRRIKRTQSSGGIGGDLGGRSMSLTMSPVKRREEEGEGGGKRSPLGSPDSIPGFKLTAAGEGGSPYGMKNREKVGEWEGGRTRRKKKKKKKELMPAEKIARRAIRTLERKFEEQKMDNMAFLNRDVFGTSIGGKKATITQPRTKWDKTIGKYVDL